MKSGLLVDNIPVPIITTDNKGVVLAFNTKAKTLFPLESGLPFSTIFTKASKIFYETYIYPTLIKEKAVSELFVYSKNKNADKLPFFITAELVEENDIRKIYWVFFLAKERDKFEKNLISLKNSLAEITDYLNKSLKDYELVGSELSAALLFKERAFTILSHDLRGPINAISALAELLVEMSENNEETLVLINHIKN